MSFTYDVDDYVVLQSLQKTPEHNGRVGAVKELLTTKSRVTVKLFDGKLVNVKEDNMRKANEEELKDQLKKAFEKFQVNQLERILRDNGVKVESKEKEALVNAAAENELFPEAKKGQTPQQQFDPEEEVNVPGIGPLKRKEMWAQADQLERMTVPQMKEQLRMLQSRSPQELRNSNPHMRALSDMDIQAHIQQLQGFVNNPSLKKLRIEALRTGDFTKINQMGMAAMDDDTIRKDARAKLELFRKDRAAFRAQYLPDQTELSDDEIEQSLEMQANADAATLKAMRNASKNGGNMDLSSLTDEQLKTNSEMQLKMFKKDPKKFRKQMEDKNPQVKQMSDEELLFQLETLANMSAQDVRSMQSMAAGGGAPSATASGGPGLATTPNFDNMTGEQISAMFKMQRDMFKRDPKAFRKMVPQMASLSDTMIEQQLNMMAEMGPDNLKTYIGATTKFSNVLNKIKAPLDRVTGGRGQLVLSGLALMLVTIILYYVLSLVFRLLTYLFPTTFGYMAPATTGAAASASGVGGGGATAGSGHGVQVDVAVEDDAFFQENDDL
jgi:hypothetical protein